MAYTGNIKSKNGSKKRAQSTMFWCWGKDPNSRTVPRGIRGCPLLLFKVKVLKKTMKGFPTKGEKRPMRKNAI